MQAQAQAYCGIALYESVVSGMSNYQSLSDQLTEVFGGYKCG